jgi:hypothetical protein
MKKSLTLLVFSIFFLSCEKEEITLGYDKIELENYIIENYTNDAKQLYFHEIFRDSTHVNYENSIIDTKEVNKVLKIIQAVYNSTSAERDTVFEIYQIHGYYCYGFNSICLKVNTELTEIQNLSNNLIPTGATLLDNILSTYKFDSVKTSYSYPNFPWLTIFTSDEYNMIPITKEFNDIESVLMADFNKGCIGDGNTITITRNEDYAIITFSIGSGDCPAGCIYHKYWEFKVSNGKAKHIRTY